MAWRAALDSIPENLLSRQEKGELIALIVVKQTYKTEILDVAITGLDVEALSGFFRSLLPAAGDASALNLKKSVGKTLIMMKKCMEAVNRVEKGVYVSLWSTFWGEISTSTRTDNNNDFRKALVEYYGDENDKLNVDDPDKTIRCMVTDLRIPGKWIKAAHLFPKKDKAKAHLIGIKDIDDPQNGMLWNRAIEEAFSQFQIVLSWDAEKNSYVFHVIDENIFHERLLTKNLKRPLSLSHAFFMDGDTKTKFENLTFGDLDGQTIVFTNLNRPFKCALSLHGMLGVHKAKTEGKLPENFDAQKYHFDYWSQDSDTKLLHQFLQDSLDWMEGAKDDEDAEFEDMEGISFHSGSV